jgi:murein L,D-transpeptidase YafK
MLQKTLALGLVAGLLLAGCAPKEVAAPAPAPAMPTKADRVLVLKGQRELHLLAGSQTLRTYTVALGFEPEGPKRRAGDGRTPEGHYLLDRRNPESRFHRSIHISYPGPEDRAMAKSMGVEPGGDIMIHGLPNGRGWIGSDHARFDWTEGCIAVTNEEMDEIWAMVDDGTPIEIRP